jgi:hypothetical protein
MAVHGSREMKAQQRHLLHPYTNFDKSTGERITLTGVAVWPDSFHYCFFTDKFEPIGCQMTRSVPSLRLIGGCVLIIIKPERDRLGI